MPETSASTCPVCNAEKPALEMMHGDFVRSGIIELIQKKHPDWSAGRGICLSCLNHFRADYVAQILETEKGELSHLDAEVVRSLKEQELIASNLNAEFDRRMTFGEKIADKVAEFGGSWRFLILFGLILAGWIILNSIALFKRPFDPYPFILLNLVLSCLASVQAPVILMSQNRQSARDRLQAEHDYRVNLKAELEIRHLNAKVDQLLTHQWQRLLEIQQIQLELMQESRERREEEKGAP